MRAMRRHESRPLTAEQRASHARLLAEAHVTPGALAFHPSKPLTDHLDASRDDLDRVYDVLLGAARSGETMLPAADWILDNHYIIREQFLRIREHLTKGFYRKLPKLSSGPLSGFPRVFQIVSDLADSTDNVIDEAVLGSFVNAYQDVDFLALCELWAIPIMIRIVMIERLEGLSREILTSHEIRDAVEQVTRRIVDEEKEADQSPVPTDGSSFGRGLEAITKHPLFEVDLFLAQVSRSLDTARGLSQKEREWFNEAFTERHTSAEQVLEAYTKEESERQVSIANAITSLRSTSETDWTHFVEDLSVVERTLRLDPSGVYPHMDSRTRDRYRSQVEHLAEYSDVSEFDVARQLLQQAENGASCTHVPKDQHVGWTLFEPCRQRLEDLIGYSPPLGVRARRWTERHPAPVYFSMGLLIFLSVLALPMWMVLTTTPWPWLVAAAAMVAALPAWDLTTALVNWILSLVLPPRSLPRMAFAEGIPDDHRTMVVVPTLLASAEHARQQVEQLEIRAVANADPNVRFALLTGLPDAPASDMPGDAEILEAAVTAVRDVNKRYDDGHGNMFFLLHRARQWNASEGVFMEWERKRGKLEEFNRLLADPGAPSSFTLIEGGFEAFVRSGPIPYVITLDADTRLPSGAARDLARTAAHPFNIPVVGTDKRTGKRAIHRGHAVLQPRISIVPEEAGKTMFARLFSGHVGLDPYTTAVSDVYQDLFGEGIYTGKGLYHAEVFRDLLDRAFPENAVLSHDLLEGSFLRTALVTDVELFDSYPSTYAAYVSRLHRWIRGDWQLLPWIRGRSDLRVPAMGRWKMLDNLRRSLSAPAMLIFLLFGWVALPGLALYWTLLGMALLALPVLLGTTTVLLTRPTRGPGRRKLSSFGLETRMNLARAALTAAVLPDMARVALDAILRTLWRSLVSRKRRLEWKTAWEAEIGLPSGIPVELGRMWPNTALPLIWGATSLMTGWGMPIVTLPFMMAWLAAPVLTWALGRPHRTRTTVLPEADLRLLRMTACRTWAYFDRTIGPPEPWLPPDNLQVKPSRGIAHRTSPTNMGLALLAVLSAVDFGYLTHQRAVSMLGHMLESMQRLDRYRGHFYNWYDTRNASVLRPRYVSTVDSGNLLASLIVLRQGLIEMSIAGGPPGPISRPEEGLTDILEVLKEEVETRADRLGTPLLKEITTQIDELMRTISGEARGLEREQWLVRADQLESALMPLQEDDVSGDLAYWSRQPARHLRAFGDAPKGIMDGLTESTQVLIGLCDDLIRPMEFGFLFDADRSLLTIGFNEDRMARDHATYDLFASEARVASFLAIARGDLPARHWFHLSRRLTEVGSGRALVSWGGTMFEYLMPLLFMKRYEHSLLDETYTHAVKAQIHRGREHQLPWGVSESGYGMLNLDMDYQYRAFGVPELGLKRGLAQDYVVAPYATLLSLAVDPESALENMRVLSKAGLLGSMGYYEAVDYTRERTGAGGIPAIVYSYMTHHQGMGLLAICNLLFGNGMQRRFHASPLVRSVELLLQEKLPDVIELTTVHAVSAQREPRDTSHVETAVTHIPRAGVDADTPHALFLTNGRLHTCITAAGTGYTALGDVQLTRFTPDRIADGDGLFIYIRDTRSNALWSTGHQPVQQEADRYDAWLHINKFESARVDNWIETFTEVCISPLDDMELRTVTLTNYSKEERRLEITSFTGVSMLERRSYEDHPAFHNLFVQTEYLDEHQTLLAHRRPRRSEEDELWMIHGLIDHDQTDTADPVRYETDRKAFLGRGRTPAHPIRLCPDCPPAHQQASGANGIHGALGSVLDPCLSLSCTVVIGPGERTKVTFTTGAARSRSKAEYLADQYDNPQAVERAFHLAEAYGIIQLNNFDLRPEQALTAQRIGGALLFGHPGLRAPASVLERNRAQQPALWAYGISGDRPLVVAHIPDDTHLDTVRLLARAHAFWQYRGLNTDILFVYESEASYLDDLGDLVQHAVEVPGRIVDATKGTVSLRRLDDIPETHLTLLHTVAAVVIRGDIEWKDDLGTATNTIVFQPRTGDRRTPGEQEDRPTRPNGSQDVLGEFNTADQEFVINLPSGPQGPQLPPMPWVNVIANDTLGFVATERGGGVTWSRNSRENRLTPWSNDATSDPVEEAIYLRDARRKDFWSPMPGPAPDGGSYEVRHGFGYTTYLHEAAGMREETTRFVAPEKPIKITRLRLINTSDAPRHLHVVFYNRLVLGVTAQRSAPFVVTRRLEEPDAIVARNAYNNEFAQLTAGAALLPGSLAHTPSLTADRGAFLGRNGHLSAPAAITSTHRLDGWTGAGREPCAAFMVELTLPAHASTTCSMIMGQTDSEQEFVTLIQELSNEGALEATLEAAKDKWASLCSRLVIRTPSEALNAVVNGWLIYQTVACRLLGRTAFYQSGGAIGFRDQLQDAAALLALGPEWTRRQILIHAARQFVEGDVQHWWHPPSGRGVRTRISDDLLWLPWITSEYLRWTGDDDLLEEVVPFLEGLPLTDQEHERYFTPTPSHEQASVREHCFRAIDRSLPVGVHALPLIGTGDWNDGMDRVGDAGRGESVWLGLFLYDILNRFIPICDAAGQEQRAATYRHAARELKQAVNTAGWDGGWYRRAFYDDGTPLGSAESMECRIDAMSQAWAILTQAAPRSRAETALDAVEEHLVDPENGLIRLLTPPFDRTEHDPGYIKGYVPGVRENGGQYTHAAMWVIQAFAHLGRGTRAWELIDMLLPSNHLKTPGGQNRYQVEPYALAADVYAVPPHGGRGGWTWYTGSAGWMYRLVLESILGLSVEEGGRLVIRPCLSKTWEGYTITWHVPETALTAEISVRNPDGVETGIRSCTVNDQQVPTEKDRVILPLPSGGGDGTMTTMRVEIVMGAQPDQCDGSSTSFDSSP